VLDKGRDVCYQSATAGCPNGYTLSGSVCVANPACSSGGTFEASLDRCTTPASYNCASGYSYDASLGECISAADCTGPGTLNKTVDQCQASYTFGCPAGFSLSGSVCQAAPSCASPGAYSPSFDRCDAGNDVCASGLTLDPSTDNCHTAATCDSGGALNPSSDQCELGYGVTCPAGFTLDAANNVCHADAACASGGALSTSLDRCTAPASYNCASGYSYDAGLGRCVTSASCDSPGALEPSRDRCEAGNGYSCPTGFNQDVPALKCYRTPGCVSPGAYSGTLNMCDAGVTKVCDVIGFSLDVPNDVCFAAAACGPLGSLNTATDRCEADATVNCGAWSYDATAGACHSPPVCDFGAYVASADECQAAITRDCGSYAYDDVSRNCFLAPFCAGSGLLSAELDVCVADATHECPPGYTWATLPVAKCEAIASCSSGTYDPAKDGCYQGDYNCPLGDYTCADIDGSGVNKCSSFQCVDMSVPSNVAQSTADTSTYQNDGVIDQSTGECSGMFIIFNGRGKECLQNGWDTTFFNCCNTDEGSFLFLKEACPQESVETVQAITAGRAHYVGTYCKREIKFIGCIQRADMYCVFGSKLSRIVHEQGRTQLQKFAPDGNWGSPTAPNCIGFTPEEFEMLDFSQIDLSEFFGDLSSSASSQVQQQIQDSFNTFQGNIR